MKKSGILDFRNVRYTRNNWIITFSISRLRLLHVQRARYSYRSRETAKERLITK